MIDLADWIYRYYIHPIIYDTSYNPVDTITWAVVLGLAILGLVKLFRRCHLAIDERLIYATLPYILAGSSLRVIEDAQLLDPPWSYLLITPLIFFLVFLITAGSLIITIKLQGEEFHKSYAAIGFAWTLFNLVLLSGGGAGERLGYRGGIRPGLRPDRRIAPLSPGNTQPILFG